ncbi:hypothetical protein ACE6H2_022880 [Prunus campanulata]
MVKNNNVASGSGVPVVWNNQNTTIFCDLCIKEVEAGNRPGTHFKKEGWGNVRISLSKETGAEYDKSQLKNKWDALKEQWKIWKELIGKETGLGWNSKLGTIDASNEWWHNKIEINPKYAKLRRKGISPDMQEKFDRMFMNTTTTGDHAWAPSSGVLPTHDSFECDSILLDSGDDSDDPVYVPDETIQVIEKSCGKGKKRTNQQLDTQVKKEKNGNRVATKVGKVGGVVKLSQQIERMVDVIENRSTTSVMMKGSQGSSIAEVMKAVSSVPGARPGSHLWLFATRLFLNQEKREMFTTMEDPNIKLQWLNYELSEK